MNFIPKINQITISGNVSDNPKLINTQKGTSICLFQIVIKQIKNRNQIIRIITMGKIAKYLYRKLSKGSIVMVKGSLHFGEKDIEIFAQTVKT